MRLVVSPDSSPKQQIITPLLKAVVRAHLSEKRSTSSGTCTISEPEGGCLLADSKSLRRENISVTRGFGVRLSRPPDILEAILDGNYPSDLTVKKLCSASAPDSGSRLEQRTRALDSLLALPVEIPQVLVSSSDPQNWTSGVASR